MMMSTTESRPARHPSDLESALAAVETSLADLGLALQEHDADHTEVAAGHLHQALTLAVRQFSDSARRGGVPPALRRRLAMASGQVAAQREAVARATTMLDRAIDVLLPTPVPAPAAGLYDAYGSAHHRSRATGYAQA